jgi:hypothetical protein
VTGMLDVLGVGVWTASQPTLASFLAGRQPELEPALARAETQLLTPRMRGRASSLTLMFANVIEQATAAAQVDRAELPMIFASAYGEMVTTLTLLDMLNAPDARLSPAKFQASVHNTAAGQLSIAEHNRSFSTSLAAGHDSVAMALIEAHAWLARTPGCVVVACADEAAPRALAPQLGYEALAAAWVLSNVSNRRPVLARLGRVVKADDVYESGSERDNPCAAALPFSRALFAELPSTVILNRATRSSWQIEVQPSGKVSPPPIAAGAKP